MFVCNSMEHAKEPAPSGAPQVADPLAEVLRFLMEQHGLRQEGPSDRAPQGRISDILLGRREVSKAVAKRLAQQFQVRADQVACTRRCPCAP